MNGVRAQPSEGEVLNLKRRPCNALVFLCVVIREKVLWPNISLSMTVKAEYKYTVMCNVV